MEEHEDYPLLGSAVGEAYRAVLADLRELNGVFLDLLVKAAGGRLPVCFGLPQSLTARLAALAEDRRGLLLDCPYALFELRPVDPAFWQAVAETALPDEQPAERRLHEECRSLSVAALGCAWHLYRRHRRLAALAFGVNTTIGEALGRTPLAFLHGVVVHNPVAVTARLADHPFFWPDLISATESGTLRQLEAACLAGLHLIAAGLVSS